MDTVTVKIYNMRHEADLALNLLKQAGIPAHLRYDNVAGIALSFNGRSGYQVEVFKKDLAEAERVLGFSS